MSTNISKQKREDLLAKIKEIRNYIAAAPQDENIYLVGLIAISLIQNLLPIVTLKYITAVCIFIILHILFVLLESVAQMYLTFWANKK